ncbi:MAG: lipopolysaccharide transport system permease protein [Candidatus Azotimanducaceae bacterium]|jgi:lipopolysaccharide transport system permease protein
MSLSSWRSGFSEYLSGLAHWRIVHLLGISLIRTRYARSKIGQFWLVLSTSIFLVSFGVVWSVLWKRPIDDYLPYIAISHVLWGLITLSLMEATTAFQSNYQFFMNERKPFSVAVFAVVYRNSIIFSHNIIVVAAIFIYFSVSVGWVSLWAILFLGVVLLQLLVYGYLLALLCCRYRDLIQLVNSFLQIAFFLTPVIWQISFIPAEYRWIDYFNPLSASLEIVRGPLLGYFPDMFYILNVFVTLSIGAIALGLCAALFGRKIIYWV